VTVAYLRLQGWNNPEGDNFFAKQRATADAPGLKGAKKFYTMTQNIGKELQASSKAFTVPELRQGHPRVLDIGTAPGGFLYTAMNCNPHASAIAYSLPVEDGGYEVLFPGTPNVEIKYMDVTMLAEDMCAGEIPADHPDCGNFLPKEFSEDSVFDVVVCGAGALRTHSRAAYWEHGENTRLTATQLVLGLEHVMPGGTMVVLLHKPEWMNTAEILHLFSHFSSVKLFKPVKSHAKRSSFYMVASKIQSKHPKAVEAVEGWKRAWKVATFGSDEDRAMEAHRESSKAVQLLDVFGPDLIRMARSIWDIQARALAKAPFITRPSKIARSSPKGRW
jgi:23S rRNA U2552 (ribose-2'-O)-methylase RlmE/FtsJ